MTVEEEVGAAFDKGWPTRLADLGGPAFLRGREEAIARVALMPDILPLVLAEPQDATGRDTLDAFVLACVEVLVGDDAAEPETYKDAVEALAAASLGDELAERCQDVLTRRVRDTGEDEVVRWSALGASLQLAIAHPDLKHDLLRTLVRIRPNPADPHTDFARKAAKVAGVAMAHWPDPSLAHVLEQLSAVEVFVRPAIEARLVREETAEAAVMAWLDAESGDPDSTWREAAADLLRAIRRGRAPPGKRKGTAAHWA